MQRTVEKVFFALIRFEINGEELCEDIKNLITPEMLPALFKLSKRHDLAHLIGDALDKNGLLPDGTEAQKRFLQERNMAVYRYEQIQYEYEQICDALEKAKIPFIPLKGSVIRSFYPEPWMRTSCDIDILVKEENLSSAIAALVNNLEYVQGEKCFHDVSLMSPSNVHLELHYNLIEKDDKMDVLLEVVWDNVHSNKKSMMHLMQAPYMIFYLFAHMKHHFLKGGCGVRAFLDIYLLLDRSKLNYSGFEELCEKGGILKFARESINLAFAWFSKEESKEFNEVMHDFILTGGVYGQVENKVLLQQAKKGNRFKYLCSRIWLPYKWLKYSYPSLEGKRWLTFFYQIRRWFSIIVHKRVGKGVNELKASKIIEKDESIAFAEFIKELEL